MTFNEIILVINSGFFVYFWHKITGWKVVVYSYTLIGLIVFAVILNLFTLMVEKFASLKCKRRKKKWLQKYKAWVKPLPLRFQPTADTLDRIIKN